MWRVRVKAWIARLLLGWASRLGHGEGRAEVEPVQTKYQLDRLGDVRDRIKVLFDEAVRNKLPYYSNSYERDTVYSTIRREYPGVDTDILIALIDDVVEERYNRFS